MFRLIFSLSVCPFSLFVTLSVRAFSPPQTKSKVLFLLSKKKDLSSPFFFFSDQSDVSPRPTVSWRKKKKKKDYAYLKNNRHNATARAL